MLFTAPIDVSFALLLFPETFGVWVFGFRSWVLGFRCWVLFGGVGFWVLGLGFGFWDLGFGFGVLGFGFWVSWSEIRVQSSGFRDSFRVEPSAEISVEFKFRVQGYTQVGDSGFGFRIEGFGLRVPGLGFRVQTQRRSIKMVVGVPCFYYQLLSIDYYQFLLRWCLVFRVKPSAEVSVGFGRGARSPSSLP